MSIPNALRLVDGVMEDDGITEEQWLNTEAFLRHHAT